MQELELSKKILDDILDNGTPFNEALRKVFQADPSVRPLRSVVAGLVGCELRHHLLFAEVLSGHADFNENEKRYAALSLGDLYFVKRIEKPAMAEALKAILGEEKYASLSEVIDNSDHPETLLPAKYDRSSNKYLSLRYNTPEWALKIWQHFGYGVTYKILRKNARPGPETVRVRTSKVSVEEVLNNNPDFVKSPVEGMLLYGGKVPLRRLPLYRDGTLFSERLGTKYVLDSFKITPPLELFAYVGKSHGALLKELVESYGNTVGMSLGVEDLNNFGDVSAMIRQDKLTNVNFFAAKTDAVESAISRPQDLVIVCPESSHFDWVREEPDYLLHFDRGTMDATLANEKASLENLSRYVAEGGTLLYMVYTISKREGHRTVEDFLLAHPDFELIKEEQLFPFDAHETGLYYAALRHDSHLVKDPAPLESPIPATPSAEVQASAQASK